MTEAPASDLPIILLAAGQSSRMRGRDKLMEVIDGAPLVRRQAEAARAATSGPVLVTLPVPPHPRYAALDGLDVQTIGVADASLGLSASLRAGLASVPQDAPAAMLCLADLPELTCADMVCVLEEVRSQPKALIWRATAEDGTPGHPTVFARDLFDTLMHQRGDTGGADVIRAHRDRTVFVPLPGTHATRDLDTPEDWAAWRAKQALL